MLIGYARTSTTEQKAGLEAQRRDLAAAGVERVYEEQASAVGKRPVLEQTIEHTMHPGDVLVVTKIDRLARSVAHLVELVGRLEKQGKALRILNMGGNTIDTKSATDRLILNIFAGFAQFEREMMLERQREGIAKAQAEGKYRGRKATAQAKYGEVGRLAGEGLKPDAIAERLGISIASVYRGIAENRTKSKSSTGVPSER